LGHIYKGLWKHNTFEYCLILSLIINVICQFFYIPFSDGLFDITSNFAHVLKIASYILVLIGLLIDMNKIYLQAEMANRSKSEFLNVMSHELRTPLTVILGYTPLLTKPDKLPAFKKLHASIEDTNSSREELSFLFQNSLKEIAKYTNSMDKSGKQLLSLINDILDLSKIEADMMQVIPTTISIKPQINKVSKQFDKSAKDKGLSIIVKTDDFKILADEIRLNQILINILGNAIKFTDKGIIDISCHQIGDFIEISISDTGRGIEAHDLNHIFEQFTQIDATTTRYVGGSGLGLTITKKMVKLHGGKIRAQSTLGQGTTFSFTIPISK
jgi:two-component system, cell cycle sensor histidine kinase PleC